jgi:uncharacterized protein (DUF362 family)
MKRREFFARSLAGAAAFGNLRSGMLRAAPVAGTTTVALVKTTDRARGVKEILRLVGPPSPKGKSVVIKPNFNTQDPTPGSTHNDTLRQIVLEMKALGASRVTVGERSGPPQTKKVMEDKGIPALARELGFEVVDFEDLGPDGWKHFAPPGIHWQNGFDLARPIAEAEYLVSTCCLKTHGFGGVFSMSLKLSVGATPKSLMRELHGARTTHMRRMIAELSLGYKPQLIVMDGIDVFTDGGPGTGTKAEADVFVGGVDRVAVDAVGLSVLKLLGSNDAIMNTKIFAQEQIARAVELGLGVDGPNKIEIVAPDEAGREMAGKLRAILDQG